MSLPRRAVAIVPVRLGSQRLPGKALLAESGTPLFLHTFAQARRASALDSVVVATDDDDVARAAAAVGAPVVRTSHRPRTGSERCAEAAAHLDADVIIDVQGDWPEIAPDDLSRLAAALLEGEDRCATLAVPLRDAPALADRNVVKVVRGINDRALYFSRAAIPCGAPLDAPSPLVWRHVGVYGFARETLMSIPELPSSGLAQAESLEQLRFLENGISMRIITATGTPWGIESRADYDAFLLRHQQAKAPS